MRYRICQHENETGFQILAAPGNPDNRDSADITDQMEFGNLLDKNLSKSVKIA
jgi:hypothetical protein